MDGRAYTVYQEFIAFIMNQLHLEGQRLEFMRQQGADEAAKLKEDVVSSHVIAPR